MLFSYGTLTLIVVLVRSPTKAWAFERTQTLKYRLACGPTIMSLK